MELAQDNKPKGNWVVGLLTLALAIYGLYYAVKLFMI